ncbi:hypothetical protein PGIGA_G00089020 [Pangasianodon gigas]|uniref:Uncharacterized protein n=1 Tax=Pangasianodon gigas TaxID=30993 RepID=A0ACC5XBS5_PANGG|nr:hypothetical protein [Pangasianodon gigas]
MNSLPPAPPPPPPPPPRSPCDRARETPLNAKAEDVMTEKGVVSGEYCFGPGLHSRLLQWTLIQVAWMHLDVCHACSGWYASVFGIARLCSQ